MASKQVYYFPHYANARGDIKMIKLRARHGLEGYAVFFLVMEVMRETTDYKIRREDLPVVAEAIGVPLERLKEILASCTEIGLYRTDGDYLLSDPFVERMEEMESRNKRFAKLGQKGGQASAQARYARTHAQALDAQAITNQQTNKQKEKTFFVEKNENPERESSLPSVAELRAKGLLG